MGPLLGNELPVPTKDCVGSDERCDLRKRPPSDRLASHSQAASLVVGQAEPSATDLLLENSVLLAKIFDDRILLTADPAGQGGNKDLPGLKNGGHPLIVDWQRRVRQLSERAADRLELP